MEKPDAEDLICEQLTRCGAALEKCLVNADKAVRRTSPYYRKSELEAAVELVRASAQLGAALARLRGQTIRVTREGVAKSDGSNRTAE